MVAKSDIRLETQSSLKAMDPDLGGLREEARLAAEADPVLAAFLYSTVLNHRLLEECDHCICERLDRHPDMQAILPARPSTRCWPTGRNGAPSCASIFRPSTIAIRRRLRFMEALLYFKGFHALQTHRLPHWLLNRGRRGRALYLQSRFSIERFPDRHQPAARHRSCIFLDYADGLYARRRNRRHRRQCLDPAWRRLADWQGVGLTAIRRSPAG